MLHISVTGHRPPKLGGYANCAKHRAIRRHMRELLTKLKAEYGEITIYSGGANGIDQFWMEVGHYLEIPVIAIIPFKGYEKLWPEEGQKHFHELLDKCVEIRYTKNDDITSKAEAASANFERNKDLVKVCDIMIAYWDGTKGGTAHAVKFAQDSGKELRIFNPNECI